MSEPRHLLVKRGLFYGPNNQGYTGVKERAGRYPESDARPADGVTAIHEDEAPMFAPACWHEVKVEFLLGKLESANTEIAKLWALVFRAQQNMPAHYETWHAHAAAALGERASLLAEVNNINAMIHAEARA